MERGKIIVFNGVPVQLEVENSVTKVDASVGNESLQDLLNTLENANWVVDGELPRIRPVGEYTIAIKKRA